MMGLCGVRHKFFVYFAESKIEQKTTNTPHKSTSVSIL